MANATAHDEVYHPDLADPNSDLFKQKSTELCSKVFLHINTQQRQISFIKIAIN